MKNKLIYIITIIMTLFIGISATLVVVYYFPLQETPVNKTVSNVNITENDSIKASIDKIYDAVVVVESYNNRGLASTGTGFYYKKDNKYGYLITNHHVIDGASSVKIMDNDGQEYDAKILGSDEVSDVAVLSVDVSNVKQVASIGDSTKLELGDTLFTVGSPLGVNYKGSVTKGILSGQDRTVTVSLSSGSYVMEVLQTDAAINPGNSGGPLLNINGEVIGITSSKLADEDIEGMGFAIRIELAMSEVDRLEKGEEIERPVFGIEAIDVSNTYSLFYNRVSVDSSIKYGIVIVNLEDGYAASNAGLQKGDVIYEIDGKKIEDMAHFRFILYKYSVGDEITVKYYRNGKSKEAKVVLTSPKGE